MSGVSRLKSMRVSAEIVAMRAWRVQRDIASESQSSSIFEILVDEIFLDFFFFLRLGTFVEGSSEG